MRKIVIRIVIMFFACSAFAMDMAEQQKINALLDDLTVSNITFIIDSKEHDGKFASRFLEEKLAKTPNIETAEDFVIEVASKSDKKKPYIIKEKDGTKLKADKWFHNKLEEITDRQKDE